MRIRVAAILLALCAALHGAAGRGSRMPTRRPMRASHQWSAGQPIRASGWP